MIFLCGLDKTFLASILNKTGFFFLQKGLRLSYQRFMVRERREMTEVLGISVRREESQGEQVIRKSL